MIQFQRWSFTNSNLSFGADDRIDPSEFKNQEWLFPETTVNADILPFQYKGMCANALIKYGLLLPGIHNSLSSVS